MQSYDKLVQRLVTYSTVVFLDLVKYIHAFSWLLLQIDIKDHFSQHFTFSQNVCTIFRQQCIRYCNCSFAQIMHEKVTYVPEIVHYVFSLFVQET